LLPYLSKEKEFEGSQIKTVDAKEFYSTLLKASIVYSDKKYSEVLKKYVSEDVFNKSRELLLIYGVEY